MDRRCYGQKIRREKLPQARRAFWIEWLKALTAPTVEEVRRNEAGKAKKGAVDNGAATAKSYYRRKPPLRRTEATADGSYD